MTQTDVAIIGGGINGSSTGLELAKNGQSVTIIDKNFICRGASGVNAGTLTMHMTRAQLIPYAKKGWELIYEKSLVCESFEILKPFQNMFNHLVFRKN